MPFSPARREAATGRAFLRFLVVGSTSVLIDLGGVSEPYRRGSVAAPGEGFVVRGGDGLRVLCEQSLGLRIQAEIARGTGDVRPALRRHPRRQRRVERVPCSALFGDRYTLPRVPHRDGDGPRS